MIRLLHGRASMNTPVSPPAPPRELSFVLDPTFAEHLRAQKAAQAHGRGRQVRLQQRIGAAIGVPLGSRCCTGATGGWTGPTGCC